MSASAPHGIAPAKRGARDSGTGMRVGDRPILPLWLRGGVLAFVLCAVGSALLTGPVGGGGPTTVSAHERGDVVASRALRFVDVDGGVSVVDALDGGEIERIDRGEDGFIRSVMRGFAGERRSRALGAEAPFAVVLHEDGSLWLDDPATGRHVVLSAFGTDNAGAFARLLAPGDAGALGASAAAASAGPVPARGDGRS